ncbi:hypothetical protein BGZ61DRAFT_453699 [Ilyonectria robusta]|uniref:uncharacterized protein n=1 Tax=Ilyonectria robusta TaxID=1079257 RepID=UPI001E8D36E5|nr:uncharacterized protein BGZ61DRAFT_453699 [Ilyonectria robusta]KAH8686824.1 hypothetical protein BGZ61DRAFT_453699 [Ilyonectria robusta]
MQALVWLRPPSPCESLTLVRCDGLCTLSPRFGGSGRHPVQSGCRLDGFAFFFFSQLFILMHPGSSYNVLPSRPVSAAIASLVVSPAGAAALLTSVLPH